MAAQLLDDDGNVISSKPKSNINPPLMDDNGNTIGEHPHSGLTDVLASFPDKTREFLSKHPIINDILNGATKTPSGLNITHDADHVPGVAKGFDSLADKIDNPKGEGGYLRGFAGGALHGIGNILGGDLYPLPSPVKPKGFTEVVPGGNEPSPITSNPVDFEGIKNRAVDAEIVPNFKTSNAPVKELPSFNHDLPAEFAPVDSAVDVSNKSEIKPQTSPDELGYNRVLENQGKKELEPLPKGWEHTGGEGIDPMPDDWDWKTDGKLVNTSDDGEIDLSPPNPRGDTISERDRDSNMILDTVQKTRNTNLIGNPDDPDIKDLISRAKNVTPGANDEPNQALATVSNEHQVLIKPDTIRSMTGVEDGFAQPKFEEDKVNNTNPIPAPGMAKPEKSVDDASDWDLQFNSMNKLLDKYESTKGISKVITDAQDIKQRWLYGKFREFKDIFDGLNDEQAKAVAKLQNHGTGDIAYNQANNITPDMINRADQLKSSFDDLHQFMVQMGVKGNKGETKLGYLSQYFPMMKRGPEGMQEQIKDIWAHYVGKENPFYKLVTTHQPEQINKVSDQVNDMYDKGTSMDPWAAFTMSRTGNMNPADIEWNPRKVIPAYLESAAKVTFDGPAIEKAESLLKQNAESMSPRLKVGAGNYIKNYSGYDAQEPLARDWNSLARSAANKVANSLISFNPGVHLLHAGEIPADILPGLGPYYTTIGIKDFFLNIHKNFQDMASLGLLQDEVKPMAFKTLDEKIDSIGYYRSYVESIVKGIAYRGALAKALDNGLAHPDAVKEAIKVAKDLTLTVDKARQMAALTPESKAGAGGPVVILAGQFKGIPLKYIEQQEDFIKALAANPKALNAWGKVALSMLGTAGAYAFGKEVNKKLIHIESPTDLIMGATTGPLSDILKRMINDTTLAAKAYQKGDMQQAKNYSIQSIMDVATLFTKGGNQIRKLLPDSISKPGSTGNKGKMRLRFNSNLKP